MKNLTAFMKRFLLDLFSGGDRSQAASLLSSNPKLRTNQQFDLEKLSSLTWQELLALISNIDEEDVRNIFENNDEASSNELALMQQVWEENREKLPTYAGTWSNLLKEKFTELQNKNGP